MARSLRIICRLLAFLVVIASVLSRLRPAAPTFPVLFAYDVAVRSTAATQFEAGLPLRPGRSVPAFLCDDALDENGSAVDRLVAETIGAARAYDGALEFRDRPDLGGEGVIYDAAEFTTAAEGAEVGGIRVTEKGMQLLERNLARVDPAPYNDAMVARLRSAMGAGERVTGGDANFYLHEISEGTFRAQGLGYDAAHAAALGKYGASPFSIYPPEIISAFPGWFNNAWRGYWGMP